MPVTVTETSQQQLRQLPVPARPKVDAADVVVPEGYKVEPVLVGLTFTNSITFADDGSLFVCEGGHGWPPRPFLSARVLRVSPDGKVDEVVREHEGALMGITWHDGAIFASMIGSRENRLVRYDVQSGARTEVVTGLPGGGIHPLNAPRFGPDGMIYFTQGSATLNGIHGPIGYLMGFLSKNPMSRDVPGEDITLTGLNVRSPDPGAPFPMFVESTGFKPFGVPGTPGEKVKGETKCTASLLRCRPDGSELELLAWGIREGFGLAFDERGELYVSNFCMEDNGIRPIGNDPGAIFHIKNARRAPGNIGRPEWYGFPDFGNDGEPVDSEKHVPSRGPAPMRIIENPPKLAGKAVFLNEPHTGMGRMDFSRHAEFGHKGHLFLCQFGSFYPTNTSNPDHANQGFNVVRVNVENGTSEVFMHNKKPGPASKTQGSGGIERPVDCKFSPDGKSLYVLDYGVMEIKSSHMASLGKTGVLWRITKEVGA